MNRLIAVWLLSLPVPSFTIAEPPQPYDPEEIAYHWKQVKDYRALVDNPENYEKDPATGFGFVDVPDIEPSLAFLVAAGEMQHTTLVLPDVPKNRTTTRHWLDWGGGGKPHGVRDGLWEMTDNPLDTEKFGITGAQPLQLKIWYDESITHDIKQLVHELQTLEDTAELLDTIDRLRNPPPKRQAADPVIPPHPKRHLLVGQWQSEGQTIYHIKEDGGITRFQKVPSPPWESVINNVHWEGGTLRFDEYHYLNDPENPGFEHPFSGVRCESTLTFHADPDLLIHRLTTKHTPEPLGGELTRVVEPAKQSD